MTNIDELIKNSEDAGYETFWQGQTSDEQIDRLESLLELKLPRSFRGFLSRYGGGGIVDAELSGIEENDASNDAGGTVYGDTIYCREDYALPEHLAVIFFRDDEICWCLDTSAGSSDDECPVVSYNIFTKKVDRRIANSFSEFLEDYFRQRSG